jgi:hypothetical protein
MHSRLLLRTLLGAAAALALGASPAVASIARIAPDGYLEVVETSPGEQNSVYIKVLPKGGVNVIEVTDLGNITPGAGCRPAAAGVECDDPPQSLRVSLGPGDDTFGVSEVGTPITFGAGSVVADLGPGNDRYDASATNAALTVNGGDGNDVFEGSKNVDHLDGGPGDDELHGYAGADELRGGPGDDKLQGDIGSNAGIFGDLLDGGDGRDTLSGDYIFDGDPPKAPPISITLDGVANDGRQGENDNITGIEVFTPRSAGSFTGDDGPNEFTAPEVGAAGTLVGNGGDDTLIAGDAHGDTVDGGAGNDLVEGGFGDDRLVGGPGRDTVNGDRKSRCNEYSCDLIAAGNDMIEVRDGEVDSVTCGVGTDKVIADAADVVAADCETVERAATTTQNGDGGKTGGDGGKTGGDAKARRVGLKVVSLKLATVLKRGLKVQVTNAKGTVTLTARRGSKVMAKGSARARGGKATVTLRFTKAAKQSLRAKRKVALRLGGGGATSRVIVLRR